MRNVTCLLGFLGGVFIADGLISFFQTHSIYPLLLMLGIVNVFALALFLTRKYETP